jgi:hypothetical protein
MGDFAQDLDHITRNEAEPRESPKETALSDYQILSIGTIELDLRYLNLDHLHRQSTSIIACCDRPALFYIHNSRLDMQYLREDVVNQASMISVKVNNADVSMIAYENANGKITVGMIEPQTKL